MIHSEHTFMTKVSWQRSSDSPKRRNFSRAHIVHATGLPDIPGSSAKLFHGDSDRWNPEQMLLAAVAQCHMMTFLFLAQRAQIVVTAYEGSAEGVLSLDTDGIGGQFTHISLTPTVHVHAVEEPEQISQRIADLLDEAEGYCFIARSLNVPITLRPKIVVGSPDESSH